jgi:tetratricopeptide (TPR) repeat protein
MFRAARDGFAARYGIEVPARRPDLEHPDFGLTLAVHMAALVAVDAEATGRRAPEDLAGLTVYLLDREQLGWALLHEKRGQGQITVPPAVMNQAVFAASLGGTQPTARGTLLVDELRLGHPPPTVLADHAVCYPPPDPAADTVLEPLLPDRLAEDFVALTLPGHPADYPAQDWAPEAAAVVLRHCGGPARPVTALATAAVRWPHVGRACLYPMLSADPGLGVAAGGAALTALAGLPDITPDLLEEIVARVPDRVPADLTVGRAAVLVRLFEHRLAATDDIARQARLHVNHGNNLNDLGRTEEALQAARRGAELFRALAATDPEQYEEHVGRALTNVANQLAALGRLEEALSTQQQVVEIFERLVAADRPADLVLRAGDSYAYDDASQYAPHLATALANLSTELERAGRWEEAYLANERATQTYRNVADRDPQYRRGLAIALTNAATLTFRAPGGADALREAVSLARELVAEGALVEDTSLVMSLSLLRKQLTDEGRHEEAVEVAREAAAINRRLAEADHLNYAEAYADSLSMLQSALLSAHRPEEAVEVGEEAVARLRRLADEAPATYETALVGALHAQNDARRAAGLPEDPEAAARSRRVEVHPVRRVPAATVTVHGWLPEPRHRQPLPTALIGTESARLAGLRDWPAYWELVCAAPLADALRLVRRLPRRGWLPASRSDQELLGWLRATSARRAGALIAEAAKDATRLLPDELAVYSALYATFTHGGAVLAQAPVHPVPGGEGTETVETLDLSAGLDAVLDAVPGSGADPDAAAAPGDDRGPGRGSGADTGPRTVLYRGPVCHGSLACLGAADVVAVRRRPGRGAEPELVRYGPGGERLLAKGTHLLGLRLAATAHGCVAGLALGPVALTLGPTGRLRQVDLAGWSLARGDRMAVTPAGDRLVLCDGHRLIAADATLTRALAVAAVPQEHAEVSELIFADDDLLVTAGNHGGLMLWRLDGFELEPVARRDTVRLSELFAVPDWGVVGAKAGSEDHVYFFDPADGLTPVPAPAIVEGDADRLSAVLTAPGGRYVLYAGQLDVGARPRRRSFDWRTRVHDLHHPGAILGRPLASLTDSQLDVLSHATAPRRRDLLRLAYTLGTRL